MCHILPRVVDAATLERQVAVAPGAPQPCRRPRADARSTHVIRTYMYVRLSPSLSLPLPPPPLLLLSPRTPAHGNDLEDVTDYASAQS